MEVWVRNDWPPENHPTPPDFDISPNRAYRAVAESKRLSLKHNWVCYRDAKFYYMADRFGMSIDASNVAKRGVRVHGKTGQVDVSGGQ